MVDGQTGEIVALHVEEVLNGERALIQHRLETELTAMETLISLATKMLVQVGILYATSYIMQLFAFFVK